MQTPDFLTRFSLGRPCFKMAGTHRPTDLIRDMRLTPLSTRNFAVLTLALVSAVARAQTPAEAPGLSSASMLQMLLGLTLIVAILFFGAYALRKLNGGRNFGNTGPLHVVGGLMISARERIILIEVGDSWIVVGIVPGQIKTLHTLPKGELPVTKSGEKPFVQWLKQITERHNENQ
jgi:flagellar protein FliO/FliZ